MSVYPIATVQQASFQCSCCESANVNEFCGWVAKDILTLDAYSRKLDLFFLCIRLEPYKRTRVSSPRPYRSPLFQSGNMSPKVLLLNPSVEKWISWAFNDKNGSWDMTLNSYRGDLFVSWLFILFLLWLVAGHPTCARTIPARTKAFASASNRTKTTFSAASAYLVRGYLQNIFFSRVFV